MRPALQFWLGTIIPLLCVTQRDRIEQYIRRPGLLTDSMTRERVYSYVLIPNRALKSRIDDYKAKRNEWRQQHSVS